MAIRVACGCGKAFDVTEKHAGKTLKCPGCNQPIVIPVSGSRAGVPVASPPPPPPNAPGPVGLFPGAATPYLDTASPHKGGAARRLLVVIAWLSGVGTFLVPFAADNRNQRDRETLAFYEVQGDRVEVMRLREKISQDAIEGKHDGRTALLALTVSLAGLACSRR